MKKLSRKAASIIAAGLLGAALLPAPGAQAGAGPTTYCDADGHCITATGFRTTAGAACAATTNGASAVTLTCSGGSASASSSGPGSAFVVLTGPVSRLCWTATGYFVNGHVVSVSGCE